MRIFGGHGFRFEGVADELWRVTAEGGVVVWVVRDAIVAGSETGTSSEQRLYFRDLGFRLHHTMVMYKPGTKAAGHDRYGASLEYAFILAKGKPRTINLLRDWETIHPGERRSFRHRNRNGRFYGQTECIVGTHRFRGPIWSYGTGRHVAKEDWARKAHPALMHEAMARDMILSWSRPGDLVFDPMCGLGTTCKMALLSDRRYLGMEIHQEYADQARRRLQDATEVYLRRISDSLLKLRPQVA